MDDSIYVRSSGGGIAFAIQMRGQLSVNWLGGFSDRPMVGQNSREALAW